MHGTASVEYSRDLGQFGSMNIALLHDSVLPPKTYGGIERILMALARAYRKCGHRVVILCRKDSTIKDFETIELPKDYQDRGLEKVLPSDIDFLHSHQPLKKKPSIPFLVSIHGNGHPEERYWANTNFLSQSHSRNHNARYFVYNGVDPEHYPLRVKKKDYFVFLARTTWRVKNVATAIAWARDLGLRLEIMGGKGISRGGIHYNGLVDEQRKLELLSEARGLIYPTNWDEPCAAAPLEALACGTPVISSANGCMPELVKANRGFVCENYDQLLQAGREVDKIDPRVCRRSIEEFFSLSRMAEDYLKIIKRILEKGDLDHRPCYKFDKSSVKLLFKPTVVNRLKLSTLGKV